MWRFLVVQIFITLVATAINLVAYRSGFLK